MIANDPTAMPFGEMRDAIGAVEASSIAKGIEMADAVIKEAPVKVLWARPIDPGKFLCLFTGEVEEVRSSLSRGRETCGDALLDDLFIPQVHSEVAKAFASGRPLGEVDALGVIECAHAASLILAADAAAKTGAVRLLAIRLAQDLGGKGYVTLTGEVSDVRAAVEAGAAVARTRNTLIRQVVVPRPDPRLLDFLD